MLIHIAPKFFDLHQEHMVRLIDITIPELNLKLKEGVDVVVRKPYPNKGYSVACRKIGRKAIDGIFIKTDAVIDQFSVLTRWSIDAEQIVEHHVQHKILDRDFDVYTDDPVYWYATGDNRFQSRWPGEFVEPCFLKPYMETLVRQCRKNELPTVQNTISAKSIVRRDEQFAMPSIHPDRLFSKYGGDRMPSIADAFHGNVSK